MQPPSTAPPTRASDTRVTVLREDQALKIHNALVASCIESANFLRATVPELANMPDDRIRANIFLPAGNLLRIDRRLAVNMNHPPELDIQFRKNQGATGVCYSTGRFQLTRRLPANAGGEWDSSYKMTPELNQMIHKNLKWIYSFPIRGRDSSEVLGVLNVDGLVNVSDDDILHRMAAKWIEAVNDIGDNLASLNS